LHVDNALERARDVLFFVLFGVLTAMLVSATNGVAALALAHIIAWPAIPSTWWVWWTGDAMGVLFVTPLLLTWITSLRRKERAVGRTLELAVLALTLCASSWVSFFSTFPLRVSVYPFIIWAGLRYRQRETAATIAAICGFAIWATAHGSGPWANGSLDVRLVQLDSRMSVLAVTGLVLGAITAERRVARADLQSLLEQTKRSAETLQAGFLPEHLPHRLGLRCDALYIAAGREALIGGDWYDAFDLPDGRIVFSIGDVTGHGLDAAVSAARLRQSIFAAAFIAHDPAEILEIADRMQRARQSAPATAVVAVVDKDLTHMRYASAGHPPPIVAGPSLPARSLEYGGVPFGVGLPVASPTHTLALDPDMALLFYTDGLTEFKRDIARAESAVLRAMSILVDGRYIERPAEFIQRSVMDSEAPVDDTVLLVAQFSSVLRKSWRYDSRSSHDAHALRREIVRFIRLFAPTEDEVFRCELIVGEALANTVEHAPGTVSVDIDWTDTHPVIAVRDAGPGLGQFTAKLPDAMNENGRGLFLISSLALDVDVAAHPGGGTNVRIMLPITRSTARIT
ncbi:MAG: SpoIIE family protein phosphatase, partial [Candidatus Eremiobacteraeota bacterium]|nr:SpoIIE family protein phosphatase [Candidatus Eremiobacteraeota bacterium]